MSRNNILSLSHWINRTIRSIWSSETVIMLTFAILVGIGSGMGALIFIRLIGFCTNFFFGYGKSLPLPGGTYVILLPMLGGMIVGPLVHFLAPEAKGHGVPEVLTAIAIRSGKIRPIVVLVKAISSAISIGSGGSVGREGPIVQIGAALGSTIGQFFKLSERRTINLLACGAAAGIAATFNAPIAGIMFAIEVILGDLSIQYLSTMIVAAMTASVISRAVLGDYPAFSIPTYALKSPQELLFYLFLGILSGFVALFFIKVLYFMEDVFEKWKIPPYVKPIVGGLGLGVLGYFIPQVFGTGFDTISDTLNGKIGLSLLIILVFGKILATTLTLGSGGSGGVFAPALFIGAVMGGAYGHVIQWLFPDITASSGAYAMVGMAAVFAGAARAPITAILILFEMTHDYHIILPLMFATIISTILSQKFEPESIYTLKLKLRGIYLSARKDENVMRKIFVGDAMTPYEELTTVSLTTSLSELSHLFRDTSHHGFAVVTESGDLYGMVTIMDLERAIHSKKENLQVKDICSKNLVTVFADETIDDALRHFGVLDVGRVPVVDKNHPRRLIGILRRNDIVHAIANASLEKQQQTQNMSRLKIEATIGADLVEVFIKNCDFAEGKMLSEIPLPDSCVIVSIQRGNKVVVPRGHTQLFIGDRIIALVRGDSLDTFNHCLQSGCLPEDAKV